MFLFHVHLSILLIEITFFGKKVFIISLHHQRNTITFYLIIIEIWKMIHLEENFMKNKSYSYKFSSKQLCFWEKWKIVNLNRNSPLSWVFYHRNSHQNGTLALRMLCKVAGTLNYSSRSTWSLYTTLDKTFKPALS